MNQRHLVEYSATAARQLLEIEDYIIDQDDTVNAIAFTGRIETFCKSLGLFPRKYTHREDIYPNFTLSGLKEQLQLPI